MTSVDTLLEHVLEECGGLGKFQWLLIFVIFGSKISAIWSMLLMMFGGATPNWWCSWYNSTSRMVEHDNRSSIDSLKICQPPRNESLLAFCSEITFSSDMKTVVTEWELICDDDWIVSTLTSIQMGGVLVSGFLSGQIADLIGRKPTFFLSIFLLIISNIVFAFSYSWQMFAIGRFIIGVSCGTFFSSFIIFIIEFTPRRYRPMIMALPAWPVCSALFGLISWWLRNWKYLHYATAAVAVPFLFGVFLVPESFRWLVSRYKYEEAKNAIKRLAKTNGTVVPNTADLIEASIEETNEAKNIKRHTLLDIFKNKTLLKRSFLFWFIWISSGYSYYAITFGIEELSGSLYLNMFLMNVVEIPSQFITWYFSNCIGRRWTCFMFYLISALGGGIVGLLQVLNILNKATVINVFAMIAKLGVASAWASLTTLTTESYPTVVRSAACGFANSMARVGAMIAPQIVRFGKSRPGLMYFLSAGVMCMSAVCSALVPETKGKAMENQIKTTKMSDKYVTASDGCDAEMTNLNQNSDNLN